jgi:hypothetical protein
VIGGLTTGTGFTAGSACNCCRHRRDGLLRPSRRLADRDLGHSTRRRQHPPATAATLVVINTDQNFIQSIRKSVRLRQRRYQCAHHHGHQRRQPATARHRRAVGQRQTSVPRGSVITITGTGFNGARGQSVHADLCLHTDRQARRHQHAHQVDVLANAPTGPGALQVINNPFVGNVISTVSVPIGAPLTLTSVTQNGNVITVRGTGFRRPASSTSSAPACSSAATAPTDGPAFHST